MSPPNTKYRHAGSIVNVMFTIRCIACRKRATLSLIEMRVAALDGVPICPQCGNAMVPVSLLSPRIYKRP